MSIAVRSFAKINLGLKIGPVRADGFHELRTIYQTIALHDLVRVDVRPGSGIEIRCNNPRVPLDESNTCYRAAERVLKAAKASAKVIVQIEKRLPVQGGLGAGSSNAVATMLGLERALDTKLSAEDKLRIAAEIGSDVPLFLIGGTVLGIGNLANLLLARAATRQHEFAMRVALGAPRWQLIRMLLIEALLLSVSGAALGMLIARWTARYLLASFWAGFVPLFIDPSPDVRVLVFTAVLAIFTGVLFGIVPAWRMSRSDPAGTLRQTSRTTGGHMGRFSSALVTAQVALSLILLLGATLFVRSLRNL